MVISLDRFRGGQAAHKDRIRSNVMVTADPAGASKSISGPSLFGVG